MTPSKGCPTYVGRPQCCRVRSCRRQSGSRSGTWLPLWRRRSGPPGYVPPASRSRKHKPRWAIGGFGSRNPCRRDKSLPRTPKGKRRGTAVFSGYYTRVWESVLKARNDRDREPRRLRRRLRRIRGSGRTGGDNPATFRKLTWCEAAGLDPDLLLKAAAGEPQKMGMATFVLNTPPIERPLGDSMRLPVRSPRLPWKTASATARSLRLYKHFDLKRAWRLRTFRMMTRPMGGSQL